MFMKALVLLFVILLTSDPAQAFELFYANDCHPRVKKTCPLHKWKSNRRLLKRFSKKFNITYEGVVEYFEHVAPHLITENDDDFVLLDVNYQPLENQNKLDLKFRVDLKRMTISPLQDIAPETVSKLFKFDVTAFNTIMGQDHFIKSKQEYYSKLYYNKWSQKFERDILLFTDWKSLIHPPIFHIDQIGQRTAQNTRLRDPGFHLNLDTRTNTELTAGNKLELFVNNDSYNEKIRLIKEAKEYVFLAVMTFEHKDKSQKIIKALIDQAKAGLDVRVIVEKVWNKLAYNKTLKQLKKGWCKSCAL
jgi:hypothetical protein